MSTTHFTTFATSSASSSSSTSLATLLHRADQLSTSFNSHHRHSLNNVEAIQSAHVQLQNLLSMPSGGPVTRSRPGGGLRERGIVKVQETVEEALSYLRDDLSKMELDVEHLSALLFEADVWLADPTTALKHGLNPKEALNHVGGLFGSYQAELIRLRELLADFTTEEITVDDFALEWKVMKEVDAGAEAELSDLVDVLGAWAGASGGGGGRGLFENSGANKGGEDAEMS
ncbi:BQ2448_1958 [Microbotryum intermedium]|uniref:BQ2448_1958 protein n=1 Tax=Microbotryum intermedium TaxID=269621 RepID=A0A238FCS0_9BASI|nr:BQ2448_1958 [Microbotryum intermedium]